MTNLQGASSPPLARIAEIAPPLRPPVADLDDQDIALLEALTADARQSLRALARTIGMSPTAVADRVTRLERLGVIRGYRADLDYVAIGYPVVVYLSVTIGPGADLGTVIARLKQLPEVESTTIVTGAMDLLVRMRVSDHIYLRELLIEHIFQIPGIQRTETFLSLVDLDAPTFAANILKRIRERRAPTSPVPAASADNDRPESKSDARA